MCAICEYGTQVAVSIQVGNYLRVRVTVDVSSKTSHHGICCDLAALNHGKEFLNKNVCVPSWNIIQRRIAGVMSKHN
jgi:hypothetical protein